MLQASDLLQLVKMPNWKDISLHLYKEFAIDGLQRIRVLKLEVIRNKEIIETIVYSKNNSF